MADQETTVGAIEALEKTTLKALEDNSGAIKELDAQLQEKVTELRKSVDESVANGEKVSKAISDRLLDLEKRYGRVTQPGGGSGEPAIFAEKSFGGQFVDWIETNKSRVLSMDKGDPGTSRIAMKGASLRAHRAAVDLLGRHGYPATDENMRQALVHTAKALTLSDATNFAPVIRFPNLPTEQGRKRVMRDLMQSRSLGTGNKFEYLRQLGMGEDTAKSMTSITSTLSVATATTALAHDLRVGDRVQIEGATEAGYNGYPFVVSVPSTTTFTYTIDPATADTTTGTITWRTISRSGAAATVTETSAKPYSKLFYDTVTGTVKVIAHLLKVSKQALDDVIGLQADINTDLLMGLADKEDWELLYGTEGILTNLYIQKYTQAVTGDLGRFKAARHLITMIHNVNGMATGAVINPNDWELFDTSTGLDEHWLMPGGVNGNDPRLWRVPLAETPQIAPGTILMGDFQRGAYIVDREAANISFADQNDDDFEKNMYTIRAEERLGIAIPKPQMFAALTLTT
jgi:hypothetical protein